MMYLPSWAQGSCERGRRGRSVYESAQDLLLIAQYMAAATAPAGRDLREALERGIAARTRRQGSITGTIVYAGVVSMRAVALHAAATCRDPELDRCVAEAINGTFRPVPGPRMAPSYTVQHCPQKGVVLARYVRAHRHELDHRTGGMLDLVGQAAKAPQLAKGLAPLLLEVSDRLVSKRPSPNGPLAQALLSVIRPTSPVQTPPEVGDAGDRPR